MASLFDSPNDMHWQGTIDTYRRQDTRVYIGKILDERGDGNYTDNLTQKYTVELISWGTKVYNAKVVVPNAGYNGTGNYVTYKNGDVVIGMAKEGQLDDFMITGAVRLNGDHRELEFNGQGLEFGDAPIGPRQRKAPSNQVSLHPARVAKLDSHTSIYGVNNSKNDYEDPTELGPLEDRLMKQPIPGIIKQQNREGIDMTYAYGGIVQMTDGNIIQVANGEKHNKCTKMLEQAKRHTKIATVLSAIGTFTSTNAQDEIDFERILAEDFTDSEVTFNDVEFAQFDATNIQTFNPNATFSISESTPIFDPVTARPVPTPVERDTPSDVPDEALQNSEGSSDIPINDEESRAQSLIDKIREGFGALLRTPTYRGNKHKELADLARKQAEECNKNGAAFQHSAGLMANRFGNHLGGAGSPRNSTTNKTPEQRTGNVDPNNFSSRNLGEPKPPVENIPAHPNHFSSGSIINTPKRIIMHHTSVSIDKAIGIFQRTEKVDGQYRQVSAHYIVGRDGRIVQMVPDNKVAYHAGPAGNNNSIGIENVATRTAQGLTEKQEEALVKLVRYLTSVYNISNDKIVGHNTIDPDPRQQCPTFIWPTQAKLKEWADTYIGT